jgi:hypothetical protein
LRIALTLHPPSRGMKSLSGEYDSIRWRLG